MRSVFPPQMDSAFAVVSVFVYFFFHRCDVFPCDGSALVFVVLLFFLEWPSLVMFFRLLLPGREDEYRGLSWGPFLCVNFRVVLF